MSECPFKVGDVVRYNPSLRGHALVDGERLVIGKCYVVERIAKGRYVIVEGYRHPGGGLYWTEFEPVHESRVECAEAAGPAACTDENGSETDANDQPSTTEDDHDSPSQEGARE